MLCHMAYFLFADPARRACCAIVVASVQLSNPCLYCVGANWALCKRDAAGIAQGSMHVFFIIIIITMWNPEDDA